MKRCNIHVIAMLGMIVTISSQLIWTYYSYSFVKNGLIAQMTNMMEISVEKETFSRLYRVPLGTTVHGRGRNEVRSNIPEFAYMQESLEALNLPISIDTVNMYLN